MSFERLLFCSDKYVVPLIERVARKRATHHLLSHTSIQLASTAREADVMVEDYSILLFYHFTPLADHAREVCWHRALCERLHLCGRLRVSPQGLNGTLSGATAALGEYTRSVDARCPVEGQAIDWKFGPCALSELFQELSVRAVREVVSLGVPLDAVPLGKAARHLSAAEFHAKLAGAAESGAVVLDVRNVYESRIGRFEAAGAETLC